MGGVRLMGLIAFVAVLLIGGIDLFLFITKGSAFTLSHWMLLEGHKEPILAAVFGLVVGILFGHFWWPNS